MEPVFHLTERRYWVSGSPESLGGIGKNVKEGQTPSMTDGQLYLLNIADKRVTPLTKDFNPSVQRAVWNKVDGQIYFTAENRDCYSLYRMNPADGKILQLEVSEDFGQFISHWRKMLRLWPIMDKAPQIPTVCTP